METLSLSLTDDEKKLPPPSHPKAARTQPLTALHKNELTPQTQKEDMTLMQHTHLR
jgi:hypothetical protein